MNFRNLSVIATFFGLWLSKFFEAPSQQILAFFLIFSVGILHGSNDLSIISKMQEATLSKKRLLFFGTYIMTVIVAAALFYLVPTLALVAFIIFSAYHFGEQHWHARVPSKNIIGILYYLNYGLLILFLLFFLNSKATLEVIEALTSIRFTDTLFLTGTLVSSSLFICGLIYYKLKKSLTWLDLAFESFLVLVFLIVFGVASLIWAFAIYFIFWHSIPSMYEQLKYLYGNQSMKSLTSYLKDSLLTWGISIIGIFLLYYLVKDNDELFLPLFFSFLGAITFAHTFIMTKMFSKS
ncbi:MAG: beta-carotene 15,15'-dioxygenase, Brp/Blh family [Flavobacteriaceae bacterium]|nr:beta-carotene 15,15'-dioxygenase, Brp/Blh family [Flavobacteriaceae bacterium]